MGMKIVGGGNGLAGLMAALGGDEDESEPVTAKAKMSRQIERELKREGAGHYTPDIVARQVLDHYEARLVQHNFKPGDLVACKAASMSAFPTAARPGIVIKVLSTPLMDGEDDSSSPNFGKYLDIIVGCIVGGVYTPYHFSSSELEPYSGPVA